MADLSVDDLLDAAVRLQLAEGTFVITFNADDSVRIKFPSTRKLADFLRIPHYAILRSFAGLESEGLVRREERIGIVTTDAGSRRMADLMQARYRNETEQILGTIIFREILRRTGRT